MPLVVVKLGGSLITDKKRPFTIRRDVLLRVAEEIAEACASLRLIVVHGGGSYGHPMAKKYRVREGLPASSLKGLAETRYWMTVLNAEVTRALIDAGVPAVPVQTSAFLVAEDGRPVEIFARPLELLVDIGAVPVAFGDVVPDKAKGFSIVSGDVLAAELAVRLKAERLVYAVDVDGVYSSDPRLDPDAKLLEQLSLAEAEELTGSASGIDVTGGIGLKLACAALAARRGIDVVIGSGQRKGNLLRMLLGLDAVCTRIVPR